MGSSFGKIFRVTTFGESHGTALGCVIENCPAGLEISEEEIQKELNRRRPGQSKITTPRSETDQLSIISGVFQKKTLGSPIAMIVYNQDHKPKDYTAFKDIYRPSHADYTYQMKYGHRSFMGGGRASARTTIGLVAAGAVARKILKEKANVDLCAFVSQVYNKKLDDNFKMPPINQLRKDIEKNPVRCPDQGLAKEMENLIQKTRQEGNSLGGIIDLVVENTPPGWGEPVFDRLDALLAQVMLAIPAVKGTQVGSGFASALMKGSEHNDIFYNQDGKIRTRSNHSGGIQGGISNGEPILMKIAFKPTATINKEQKTVNQKGEDVNLRVKGRHDPCVLPRGVPIVEALASLVLVDQFLLSKTARYDLL